MIPDRFQVVEGWPEQLRRVERWHDRLQTLWRSQNGALDKEDFDIVYAFFQASHHLRDWLQNSGAASATQLGLLWEGSPALQLGEDICNNSGHYVRQGKVRVSARLGFQREYVPARGEYGEYWYVVWEQPDTGFNRVELEQLVRDCLSAWRTFCSMLPEPA